MALISTGSFPQALRPGIRQWFGDAYNMFETKYDKMFDVKIPDDRAYEEDALMTGMGFAPVKPQGSPVEYDASQQNFSVRYTHVTYGLGFVITMEMLEDGLALKDAKRFSEMLKYSLLRTREVVGANVFNNAFTSGYVMDGGDGVILASSAHPTRAGNQSNVPVTPADLSEAALEQAIIDITNFTDDRGLRIMVQPEKLIIPVSLQFTAERILKSQLRSASADNDINAVKNMGLINDVLVNPYLTSQSAWFVKTDVPDGMIFFNRKDMEIDSDNDFDTENAKFKGIMRFSQGWSDFRGLYCVNGP